ncbi:MAG: CPBP family intramembrane metalloprotease [Clostridia bacterium]|nr:CPBP family intramembrane metalloprotease [Clostridia bacterium]
MEKRNLNVKDAGIAFVMSFVVAQTTAIVGMVIIQFILQACGLSSIKIESFFDTALGYLVQAICMNIGFILVFIWYFKRMYKSQLFSKPDSKSYKYLAICIIIGVSSLFLLSGVVNYFQLFVDKLGFKSATLSYELDSPGNYIISLVSLALIPAICEELIFRGIIVNGLKSKGSSFAIILSSAMFAIFHFSPAQLIYPFCFGLILSIIYLRTHNIIFPIILHFINNALSLSIQYFSNSSGVFTHSASILIYSLVTLLIWICIIIWLFKNFKQHEVESCHESEVIESPNTTSKSVEKSNLWFLNGSIIIMLCLYILLL